MGCCPRICLVAQLKSLDPNETNLAEILEHPEYGTDIVIDGKFFGTFTGEHESGLYADDNCVGVYDYVTSGWGDSISITDLQIRITDFTADITNFCKEHNCSFTIKIQSNWY